jgi:hypothetical protein
MALSEIVAVSQASQLHRVRVVSSGLFLRFLCPAFIRPECVGLKGAVAGLSCFAVLPWRGR